MDVHAAAASFSSNFDDPMPAGMVQAVAILRRSGDAYASRVADVVEQKKARFLFGSTAELTAAFKDVDPLELFGAGVLFCFSDATPEAMAVLLVHEATHFGGHGELHAFIRHLRFADKIGEFSDHLPSPGDKAGVAALIRTLAQREGYKASDLWHGSASGIANMQKTIDASIRLLERKHRSPLTAALIRLLRFRRSIGL